MITVLMKRTLIAAGLAAGLLSTSTACDSDGGSDGRLRVIASFYPLAWAARQIAPGAQVVDLTPPGAEPHELQLTARQRLDVQNATVVFMLGKGFQPEVERAVKDAEGRVVDVLAGLDLLPATEEGISADPHVWLDPTSMRDIARKMAAVMADVAPRDEQTYLKRGNELAGSIEAINVAYRFGLGGCKLKTLLTTHEAFGYLAKRFGLTEVGLTGVTPEAEPPAAQIARAQQLARGDEIAAIFYEQTDEGERIGRRVAADVGVTALPLNTLESDPDPADYLTVMQTNLTNLRRGLRCR
jgi:zinc transport system substrate-binding protein